MPGADILLVSLGSTAGLRAADAELAGLAAPRRARRRGRTAPAPARGAHVRAHRAALGPRGPRRGDARGIAEHDPRAVALLDHHRRAARARAGAIRFDAPAAANRPGRHGLWQRPVERRRLAAAPLLVP